MGRLDYVEPNSGPEQPAPRAAATAAPADTSAELRRPAAPSVPSPEAPSPRGPARSAPPAAPTKPVATPAPAVGSAAAPSQIGRQTAPAPLVTIHGLTALSAARIPAAPASPPGPPPTLGFIAPASATDSPAAARAAQTPDEEAVIAELEAAFLRPARTELSPSARIAAQVACALLAPALLLQLALLFRSTLIQNFPDLQPAFAAVCAPLGCSAQWPMHPELLAVVSSDLQAVPGTPALELDAVVRNRADFPMALPALELTLTDSLDHPVARKVFLPSDYHVQRAVPDESDNLAAGADLSIRLFFEFHGTGVNGFEAYPFYP